MSGICVAAGETLEGDQRLKFARGKQLILGNRITWNPQNLAESFGITHKQRNPSEKTANQNYQEKYN